MSRSDILHGAALAITIAVFVIGCWAWRVELVQILGASEYTEVQP